MKKQKPTRETENMVQTALWLPSDMHERLKKAGGRRGMGEEIRALLEQAMHAADATQSLDEGTRELLHEIEDIARDLSREEPWHTNHFAFDVLKAAINAVLLRYRPSSEGKPETKARLQAVWGDEKPETIGRLIAHATLVAHRREHWEQRRLEGPKD